MIPVCMPLDTGKLIMDTGSDRIQRDSNYRGKRSNLRKRKQAQECWQHTGIRDTYTTYNSWHMHTGTGVYVRMI